MKPDFSEFSYGYAVTEELVSSLKAALVGAPIFPSLYEEGKSGGGYDLKLPVAGTPIFLQFKLSDQLERSNAKEHRDGLMPLPYYRMHLRPTKHSDQHNLLLALEASGEAVYYIAPEFHLPAELNAHYLAKTVVPNSAAFTPSSIGPLPTVDEHYVVFSRHSTTAYRCSSNPKQIRKITLGTEIRADLTERGFKARELNDQSYRDLANRMVGALAQTEERLKARAKSIDVEGTRRIVQLREPIESISYMARTFFDAELLILE